VHPSSTYSASTVGPLYPCSHLAAAGLSTLLSRRLSVHTIRDFVLTAPRNNCTIYASVSSFYRPLACHGFTSKFHVTSPCNTAMRHVHFAHRGTSSRLRLPWMRRRAKSMNVQSRCYTIKPCRASSHRLSSPTSVEAARFDVHGSPISIHRITSQR
jgi:hypothetical protein